MAKLKFWNIGYKKKKFTVRAANFKVVKFKLRIYSEPVSLKLAFGLLLLYLCNVIVACLRILRIISDNFDITSTAVCANVGLFEFRVFFSELVFASDDVDLRFNQWSMFAWLQVHIFKTEGTCSIVEREERTTYLCCPGWNSGMSACGQWSHILHRCKRWLNIIRHCCKCVREFPAL